VFTGSNPSDHRQRRRDTRAVAVHEPVDQLDVFVGELESAVGGASFSRG
jgi:hypothetical protein